MQTLKTITFFATVSNPASSRTSKNGRNYTAFGVSILDQRPAPDLPLQRRCLRQAGPLRQTACRKAPASSSSSRHSPSRTTSPLSRFSPQPSCGRFVRPQQQLRTDGPRDTATAVSPNSVLDLGARSRALYMLVTSWVLLPPEHKQ